MLKHDAITNFISQACSLSNILGIIEYHRVLFFVSTYACNYMVLICIPILLKCVKVHLPNAEEAKLSLYDS